MKRIICAMLAICVMAWAMAMAETAPGGTRESIELQLDGRALSLDFDRSDTYSFVSGGNVQAAFYTYTDNSDRLYELYMVFPEGVQPGDVITPGNAGSTTPECAVAVFITTNLSENYYLAEQREGSPFPEGSYYQIDIDAVSATDGGTHYEGRLTATLVSMRGESPDALDNIQITDVPFGFTMPAGNHGTSHSDDASDAPITDGPNPFDELPQSTPAPGETPEPAPVETPAPAPEVTPLQTWRI